MKVSVSEKEVKITEMSVVCEGDCGVNKCFFVLPKSFENLSVTAVFGDVAVPLINGECIIPSLKKGNTVLGVYAYKKSGEDLELMYSPKSTYFYVEKGSFTDEITQEEVPEISRFEEFCGMLTSYCKEQIKEHCNLKKTDNPKISQLDYGVYSVSGDVFYSNDEKGSVNIESGVLLVLPSALTFEVGAKSFYLFADSESVYKGVVGIAENNVDGFIERLPNFVEEINASSSDGTYPSSKSVYDFVLKEYTENSDRPLSGKVVESLVKENCGKVTSSVNENSANALKGNAQGSVVVMNDVSPMPHTGVVRLKNTDNLCSLGNVRFENTLTVNNAVSIPAGQYVFSAVVSSDDESGEACALVMMNSKTNYRVESVVSHMSGDIRVSFPFSVSQDIDQFIFYASDTPNNSQGYTAAFSDIKIEKGSEATEYTPYIDLSGVEVSVCGKNLFPDFIKNRTYADGSSVVVGSDGGITCDVVDGTYVSQVFWSRLAAGTYTISDGTSGGMKPYIAAVFYADKNQMGTYVGEINTKNTKSKTITTDKAYDVKFLLYTDNSQKNKFTLYPQLEVGTVSTEYEQYRKVEKIFSPENGTFDMNLEYPNTTVFTDADGINIEVEYNRDVNKAFDELKNAIISLGGNV